MACYFLTILASTILFLDKHSDTATARMTARSAAGSVVLPSSESAPSPRRFVRYIPSPWEANWTTHIDEWTDSRQICDRLLEQKQELHTFLVRSCTAFVLGTSWCAQNDGYVTMYYNTKTQKFAVSLPDELQNNDSIKVSHLNSKNSSDNHNHRPFVPTADEEHVFSKFVYRNELTGEEFVEYIEPLVSHLRHPLSMCLPGAQHGHSAANPFRLSLGPFRGFVVPPPPPSQDDDRKYYYLDGGASNWGEGLGGPSLSVLTTIWKRNGIDFDKIYAFEPNTPPAKFYKTVPNAFLNRTNYTQIYIATTRNESLPPLNRPFLPDLIRTIIPSEEDYVLFKLDIDTPTEELIVDHLLQTPEDCSLIDEFIWEHHLSANYLMRGMWGGAASPDLKMSDSYNYFRALRERGVRAHSWV